MLIDEFRCYSWMDYKKYLADSLFESEPMVRNKYLFRGQGDANWRLSSSFERAFEDFDPARRDDLERTLIENFRRECESDPSLQEVVRDETQLLALAQHYGLPTRLVDWTESPYIAAFFAFQGRFIQASKGQRGSENVAIWVLDKASYVWSPARGVQVLSTTPLSNSRLRQQFGWFTLSRTPFSSLEEYIDHFPDSNIKPLRKVLVRADAARVAMADLDLMGINQSFLFADLEGKARAALTRTMLTMGLV